MSWVEVYCGWRCNVMDGSVLWVEVPVPIVVRIVSEKKQDWT